MKQTITAAALALALAPAAAQAENPYCEDYWFVRNQLFDRSGYCFGSPLGQAVFDNSDCTGKDVALSAADTRLVARIKAAEEELGCHVDTARTSLSLPLLDMRRRLIDLAALDPHTGSGCLGWTGAAFALRAGHDSRATVLAEVQPGDDVLFLRWTSEAPGTWVYLDVERDGRPVGFGWTPDGFDWEQCSTVAG